MHLAALNELIPDYQLDELHIYRLVATVKLFLSEKSYSRKEVLKMTKTQK